MISPTDTLGEVEQDLGPEEFQRTPVVGVGVETPHSQAEKGQTEHQPPGILLQGAEDVGYRFYQLVGTGRHDGESGRPGTASAGIDPRNRGVI